MSYKTWFVHWCPECGFQGVRGSGKIKNPESPWWKFWDKIKCPNCMGTGDRSYPTMPMYKKDSQPYMEASIRGGEFTYLARDGNWYWIGKDETGYKSIRRKVQNPNERS